MGQCATQLLSQLLSPPTDFEQALNIAGRDFVSARILREFKTKSRARLVQMELGGESMRISSQSKGFGSAFPIVGCSLDDWMDISLERSIWSV